MKQLPINFVITSVLSKAQQRYLSADNGNSPEVIHNEYTFQPVTDDFFLLDLYKLAHEAFAGDPDVNEDDMTNNDLLHFRVDNPAVKHQTDAIAGQADKLTFEEEEYGNSLVTFDFDGNEIGFFQFFDHMYENESYVAKIDYDAYFPGSVGNWNLLFKYCDDNLGWDAPCPKTAQLKLQIQSPCRSQSIAWTHDGNFVADAALIAGDEAEDYDLANYMTMQLDSPFDDVAGLSPCEYWTVELRTVKFVDGATGVETLAGESPTLFPDNLTGEWIQLISDPVENLIKFNPNIDTPKGTYHMQLVFKFNFLYDGKEDDPNVDNLIFATKDLTFEIPATPSSYLVLVTSATQNSHDLCEVAKVQLGIDECGDIYAPIEIMTAVDATLPKLAGQADQLFSATSMVGTSPAGLELNFASDKCLSDDDCNLSEYGKWVITLTQSTPTSLITAQYNLEIINPCRSWTASETPDLTTFLAVWDNKVLDYAKIIAQEGIIFYPEDYMTISMPHETAYTAAGGDCGTKEMKYWIRRILDENDELLPLNGLTWQQLWTSFYYDDISVAIDHTGKWALSFTTNFDRDYGAVYLRLSYHYETDLYTQYFDSEGALTTSRSNIFKINVGDLDDPTSDNIPLTRMNSCKPISIKLVDDAAEISPAAVEPFSMNQDATTQSFHVELKPMQDAANLDSMGGTQTYKGGNLILEFTGNVDQLCPVDASIGFVLYKITNSDETVIEDLNDFITDVQGGPDDGIINEDMIDMPVSYADNMVTLAPASEDQTAKYFYSLRYYFGGEEFPEFYVDSVDDYPAQEQMSLIINVIEALEETDGTTQTDETTQNDETDETTDVSGGTSSPGHESNQAFLKTMDLLQSSLSLITKQPQLRSSSFVFMIVGQEPAVINITKVLGIDDMDSLSDFELELELDYDANLEEFVDFNLQTGIFTFSPTEEAHVGKYKWTINLSNPYGEAGKVTQKVEVKQQEVSLPLAEAQGVSEECEEGKGAGIDDDNPGRRRRINNCNQSQEQSENQDEQDQIKKQDDTQHLQQQNEDTSQENNQSATTEETRHQEETRRRDEIDQDISNAMSNAQNDPGARLEDIVLEVTCGGQQITLRPEELATTEGAISDIFLSPEIADLPLEVQQKVFDDLLQYNQRYLGERSSYSSNVEPSQPAMAFNNIESNGKFTLALNEKSAGLAFLLELEKPLIGNGVVSNEIYDPLAAAQRSQTSGRRLSQLKRERSRSLSSDTNSFDLADYLAFVLYRGADNSAPAEKLEFEVLSENMEGDILTLKIKFAYPLMVSIGTTSDMLIASIVDGALFSSSDSGTEVDPNFTMEKLLPRMLPGEEFAVVLESTAAKVETGMQIGMIAQLVICIVLAASLKAMWNFLNVIQVLVYLRFYASWSGTMMFIVEQMNNAVTLKPITGPILELGQSKFAKVNDTVTDEGLQNFGVEDNSVLKNLGLFGLVLVVILLGVLGYFILRMLNKSGNKHVKTIKEKLERKLFYNGLYRYLIISNLKLTVTLFGFLITTWSFTTFTLGTATIALITGIIAILVWPVFIIFFLERHYSELEEPSFKKKHETIYQGIKTYSKEALIYYGVFSIRRFYIVLINVTFSSLEVGQRNENLFKIVFFLILQSVYILYIFEARPHNMRIYNRLEFLNEGMLMLLAYVMLIFSGMTPIEDLVANKPCYNFAEWLGIGIALLICIMNFFVMGKMTVDKIKAALAAKKQKKLDALIKEEQPEEKATYVARLEEIKEVEVEEEKEVETINLSKKVEQMIRAANEIKCELVTPEEGPGIKVYTSDRTTRVEATKEGYKIKTKDRNIRCVPQEYVRLTAQNPALLFSSMRQEVFYDNEGNRIYKEKTSNSLVIQDPQVKNYQSSEVSLRDI